MPFPASRAADEDTLNRAVADARRLRAVRATALLDTAPEECFDRLTRLATRLVGAPVSFLSLVDAHRDFYKSHCGFGEPLATSRQLEGRTFCHHALTSPRPLVLEDVTQDAGFASVPTVRTLGIRAYAGVPIIGDDGQCIGSFCAVDFEPRAWSELDIHVLSELALSAGREIALRGALTQAREASLAKSAFLANMSHEIRTPMNAVLGFTHMLGRSGLTPEQQRQLGHVESAGQHLLGVIDDILDLSKIEADKLVLEQVPFSLPALVDDVLRLVGEPARAKQLSLQAALDEAPTWLLGDPVRLRQMLLNLAANAVKFTAQGRVCLRVRSEHAHDRRLLLRFEVQDTGVGVPAEQLPQLFQAFRQADATTTRRFGGTGLGLALVRRLSGLMGGDCGATSVAGQGSTFWFTASLEAAPPGVNAAAGSAPQHDEHTLRALHAGRRVLVAEDNPVNRELIVELLERTGLVVDVADNGQQAVAMATAPVDCALVLMDMQMPVMDGVQATREIRRRLAGRPLPIVAMTANAFDEDRRQCLEAGMDDFISKPVLPKHLYGALLKWLAAPPG